MRRSWLFLSIFAWLLLEASNALAGPSKNNAAAKAAKAKAAESQESPINWQRLPHLDRRQLLAASSAAVATRLLSAFPAQASPSAASSSTAINNIRSIATIDSNLAIPVWPSWGGGRVVPVSLGDPLQEPFLLLAHHKHWFDPRDPLRKPFQEFGKATGLPYIDVEGFSLHPHRGLDILTYILDGSDGFCHRDSLTSDVTTTDSTQSSTSNSQSNTPSRIYRGGTAQWMRTGAGVMHEEFWETSPDRRTSIELFQIWINLPSHQKFDDPAVRYVGANTDTPWYEEVTDEGVQVRHIGAALDASVKAAAEESKKTGDATAASSSSTPLPEIRQRPPVQIQHVQIPAGARWEGTVDTGHSVMMYVREGIATVHGNEAQQEPSVVKMLQSATFGSGGDRILISNQVKSKAKVLDFLLLSAKPLKEKISLGGPIVMNNEFELRDAYKQLQDGTFLDRDVAIKQQQETYRRMGQKWESYNT